jgi:hypothetical protein
MAAVTVPVQEDQTFHLSVQPSNMNLIVKVIVSKLTQNLRAKLHLMELALRLYQVLVQLYLTHHVHGVNNHRDHREACAMTAISQDEETIRNYATTHRLQAALPTWVVL